jgi:RNA polymerase sigma factor (sigma-70 family)
MKRTNETERALTKEQSDFAALHHGLVYRFLRKYGRSEEDFYDIVVFGYLDAVRDWFESELAVRYEFSTIAFRQMRFRLIDGLRAQNAGKRRAEVLRYSEDTDTDARHDGICEPERVLLEKEAERALCAELTPLLGKAARLKADGYDARETGRMLDVSPGRVNKELRAAKIALRTTGGETGRLAA